jgi:hypothetical protein
MAQLPVLSQTSCSLSNFSFPSNKSLRVCLTYENRTFGVQETIVNYALVGNLFMLGAGSLSVVALSAYFGILPILFWFSVATFLIAIWSAAAATLPAFRDSFLPSRKL